MFWQMEPYSCGISKSLWVLVLSGMRSCRYGRVKSRRVVGMAIRVRLGQHRMARVVRVSRVTRRAKKSSGQVADLHV